jgi:hypothetical protein
METIKSNGLVRTQFWQKHWLIGSASFLLLHRIMLEFGKFQIFELAVLLTFQRDAPDAFAVADGNILVAAPSFAFGVRSGGLSGVSSALGTAVDSADSTGGLPSVSRDMSPQTKLPFSLAIALSFDA